MAQKTSDTFRRNVAQVLADRGQTMQWLADEIGTARANISRILSGDEQVTLDRAGRIAKALDMPLSSLVSSNFRILQKIG